MPRATVVCDYCQSEFTRQQSALQPHNFCKRACYDAFQALHAAKGPASKRWKGGRSAHNAGYVRVRVGKDHPMADAKGDVLEHRYVMSIHLGRPLRSNEVVHHINHDRTDNRIENLELMAGLREHAKHHALGRQEQTRPDCHCGRKFYGRGLCINHYMQWHRAKKRALGLYPDRHFYNGHPKHHSKP